MQATLRMHQSAPNQPLHQFRKVSGGHLCDLSDLSGCTRISVVLSNRNNSAQCIFNSLGNHEGLIQAEF